MKEGAIESQMRAVSIYGKKNSRMVKIGTVNIGKVWGSMGCNLQQTEEWSRPVRRTADARMSATVGEIETRLKNKGHQQLVDGLLPLPML